MLVKPLPRRPEGRSPALVPQDYNSQHAPLPPRGMPGAVVPPALLPKGPSRRHPARYRPNRVCVYVLGKARSGGSASPRSAPATAACGAEPRRGGRQTGWMSRDQWFKVQQDQAAGHALVSHQPLQAGGRLERCSAEGGLRMLVNSS